MGTFLDFLFHMCHKLKHQEVALLCKVLSALLLSLQGSCGFAIILFGVFWVLLPFCFCCKFLGFLQDETEMIKCRLLNNLVTTLQSRLVNKKLEALVRSSG